VDIPEKRDPELLEEAIREARRRGTVLNIRPNRWNIAALSIPVFGSSGAVLAAVTVIGTTEDFSGSKRDKWEKILKETIKKSAS
jgi:DNA-binding IclR family transcriptional regulator